MFHGWNVNGDYCEKQTMGNLSRASRHYAKQSAFDGSRRQIRGQVLRMLTESPRDALFVRENIPDSRLESVLDDLIKEGLIEQNASVYRLAT